PDQVQAVGERMLLPVLSLVCSEGRIEVLRVHDTGVLVSLARQFAEYLEFQVDLLVAESCQQEAVSDLQFQRFELLAAEQASGAGRPKRVDESHIEIAEPLHHRADRVRFRGDEKHRVLAGSRLGFAGAAVEPPAHEVFGSDILGIEDAITRFRIQIVRIPQWHPARDCVSLADDELEPAPGRVFTQSLPQARDLVCLGLDRCLQLAQTIDNPARPDAENKGNPREERGEADENNHAAIHHRVGALAETEVASSVSRMERAQRKTRSAYPSTPPAHTSATVIGQFPTSHRPAVSPARRVTRAGPSNARRPRRRTSAIVARPSSTSARVARRPARTAAV